MNLAHFPFDIQMCTVEIESFGYTMADMRYAWNSGDNSVQMSPDVSLPQFNILGHRQRLIEVRNMKSVVLIILVISFII